MIEKLKSYNYLAILFSVMIQQVIGFIWYSPFLFSSLWFAGTNKTLADTKHSDPKSYLIPIVSSIIMVFIIEILTKKFSVDNLKKSFVFGILLWTGLIFPILFSHYNLLGYPFSITLIDGFKDFIQIMVSTMILGTWKSELPDDIYES